MKGTIWISACAVALLLAGNAAAAPVQKDIRAEFLGRFVPVAGEIGGNKYCRKNAAESLSYDPRTRRLFATNRADNKIDVLDIRDPSSPVLAFRIDLPDISGGTGTREPTSVAVDRGRVVVAVRYSEVAALPDGPGPGYLAFFDTDGNPLPVPGGSNTLAVGYVPDMITFTPNGRRLLVANEGEPNDFAAGVLDPEGSISIVDLTRGVDRATVSTADFIRFNDQKAALIASGVRIFGPCFGADCSEDGIATVAQDLEPEYIAVSDDSRTAYVTLQDNNAVAVVDIDRATVTDVLPLGFKDHNAQGNGLDASDRDNAINIANWPVFGMYQPDGIGFFRSRGRGYVVTANEGDARSRDGFDEEKQVRNLELDPTAFPEAAVLQENENIGRLRVTDQLGDADGDGVFDELYAFGARSLSVWTTDGRLVFDSGDDFETIIADRIDRGLLPRDAFNSADDETAFDSRSDNKGPEPEGVAVGKVAGRTYAFSILERVGGIMTYDVTDPQNARFVDYASSRNFAVDPNLPDDFFPADFEFPAGTEADDFVNCNDSGGPGDSGPEVIIFIPAGDSPTRDALLAVAHETTSSTALYRVGK